MQGFAHNLDTALLCRTRRVRGRVPMQLHAIDWIVAFFALAICFAPALFFSKRSGKNTAEFFASGRRVPWWLAGMWLVAATFSRGPPNLVAAFVRAQAGAVNGRGWAVPGAGDPP